MSMIRFFYRSVETRTELIAVNLSTLNTELGVLKSLVSVRDHLARHLERDPLVKSLYTRTMDVEESIIRVFYRNVETRTKLIAANLSTLNIELGVLKSLVSVRDRRWNSRWNGYLSKLELRQIDSLCFTIESIETPTRVIATNLWGLNTDLGVLKSSML